MSALLDLTRDALLLAVAIGLPLMAVALVSGLLAGWLGQLVGLADPAVSTALRGGAIVLALWFAGAPIAARVTDLTADAWGRLPALGRAGVPTPPGAELDETPAPP